MKQTVFQFLRYALVGLVSNTIGYLLYLFLTTVGFGPKLTMSILYLGGVLQTFVFNKKWTFNNHGKLNVTLFRYISIYGIGYLINFAALIIFVDRLGYPHQLVQALIIPILALILFTLQKLWVFRVQE